MDKMDGAVRTAFSTLQASKQENLDLKSSLLELEAKWVAACQRYPALQNGHEAEREEVRCIGCTSLGSHFQHILIRTSQAATCLQVSQQPTQVTKKTAQVTKKMQDQEPAAAGTNLPADTAVQGAPYMLAQKLTSTNDQTKPVAVCSACEQESRAFGMSTCWQLAL